ncbi:hypothetical protein BDN72DRAFT_902129 [Pluteus cervinus]|uniref:Uncharacterized protein n=1 Tax=Pluteus cervinus TaxID=181527 RepID=A0ACD3ADN5_9AGAR|nr:hypothetical protein BDN72DRAFT_902129 [Pluteus cervinus]
MDIPISNPFSIPLQENIEEERRKIDEEIKELQIRIQALTLARNRLAPISRIIIPEILTSIFVWARDTSKNPRGYTSLVISWVCRDWRQLSLTYPALWNDIQTTNMAWIQESIIRSRNSALSVTIDRQESKARSSTILPFFLGYLPRMRSFTIRDANAQLVPHRRRYTCSEDWNIAVPLLEELSLCQVNLTESLFPQGLPRLKSLTLSFCTPGSRDNLLSPSLVSLSLRHPPQKISVMTIVKILQKLPNLQELSLEGSMGEEILAPNAGAAPHTVHLQNLRNLSIKVERWLEFSST